MDKPDHDLQEPRKRLQALLTAAGLTHQRVASGGRTMHFSGQYREWVVFSSLNADWFHLQTAVCALPVEPGLRAELLLWMARTSCDLSLLKYTVNKNDQIVLEAQVRAERLEAGDVRNLVGFLHATAERDYLAILRLARGEARLDALSAAFKLDSVTGEGAATA
jgi:hypothetical protein